MFVLAFDFRVMGGVGVFFILLLVSSKRGDFFEVCTTCNKVNGVVLIKRFLYWTETDSLPHLPVRRDAGHVLEGSHRLGADSKPQLLEGAAWKDKGSENNGRDSDRPS